MGRQLYANEVEHSISIAEFRHTKLNRTKLDRYTEPGTLDLVYYVSNLALPTQQVGTHETFDYIWRCMYKGVMLSIVC